MSKQVLEDARAAYQAWKETTQGSYVERALADAIVRDIVPALIHAVEQKPVPIGFEYTSEIGTATDTADPDDD